MDELAIYNLTVKYPNTVDLVREVEKIVRVETIDEFVKELLRHSSVSNPRDTTAFVCISSNEIIRIAEQLKEK